jgi:hypothetical protein
VTIAFLRRDSLHDVMRIIFFTTLLLLLLACTTAHERELEANLTRTTLRAAALDAALNETAANLRGAWFWVGGCWA